MQIDRSAFRLVADDLGVGWLHVPSGQRLPLVSGGATAAPEAPPEDEEFEIPEDLSTLDDADLDPDNAESLFMRARAALDAMVEENGDNPSQTDVQAVQDLAGSIKAMKAERQTRLDAAEERRREFEAAVADIRDEESTEGEGEGGEGEGGEGTEVPPAETPEGGDSGEGGETGGESAEGGEGVAASSKRVPIRIKRAGLNLPLGKIASNAPDPGVPDKRPEVVITAAADVPHFSNGQRIETLDDLAAAASARAKALGIGNGAPHFVPLAKIERDFPDIMDADTMTPQQVRTKFGEMVDPIARDRKAFEALVAAGGWCAPSEIRYDFFQISDVAGLVDLPTFGVRRGGLRWPQSLSLFDFFALSGAPTSGLPTNATMPWEWTEADDLAAATGTSPSKQCLRPPCPNFDEARLRVFGLCVLAGNLTEDAFPELIRHFLAQTVVAHQRAINRRLLLQMVAASTATTPTVAGESATNAWLGGLDLNAVDYREKHGMGPDAVLEVVAPSWARGALRSDIAKKNGLDRLDAADAYLMDLFNSRDLRVQWVQDWQTRLATGIAPVGGGIPTNWPTTAQVMMYAPGTFGRGNGMTLDLGVVRDSVLNADNDHTAAWSEEATMLAKFGHESRVITLNTVAGGVTGAQAALTGA